MVRATFDRDRVDVVVGGLELAKAFTRVRWDHLLYTGSPAVGREIAKAAAEQLVPVTLELGGKCPAILADDSVDAESVKQMLGTKAIKNGQMCITVDYCLVPRERLEDFARLAADHVREAMPGYCPSESCTGIINDRHLERIEALLDDARAHGADVRRSRRPADVDPDSPPAARSRSCSTRPTTSTSCRRRSSGRSSRSRPTTTSTRRSSYVNAGERPLALYVFSKDEAVADDVLRRTTLRRRLRQRRGGPRRPALAAVRRHRSERLRSPPRRRGLPRVLQPARRLRPRRGRPDRGLHAAVRAGGRRRGPGRVRERGRLRRGPGAQRGCGTILM